MSIQTNLIIPLISLKPIQTRVLIHFPLHVFVCKRLNRQAKTLGNSFNMCISNPLVLPRRSPLVFFFGIGLKDEENAPVCYILEEKTTDMMEPSTMSVLLGFIHRCSCKIHGKAKNCGVWFDITRLKTLVNPWSRIKPYPHVFIYFCQDNPVKIKSQALLGIHPCK